MVQYIDAQKTQVITKNGECEININLTLNINLTNEGLNLSVGASSSNVNKEQYLEKQKPKIEDKVEWEVPDFTNHGTINFGK